MRLAQIEFKQHPILGNLKLDFRERGFASPTIVLAGDNGFGKTTILNAIAASGGTQFQQARCLYELQSGESHLHFQILHSDPAAYGATPEDVEVLKRAINARDNPYTFLVESSNTGYAILEVNDIAIPYKDLTYIPTLDTVFLESEASFDEGPSGSPSSMSTQLRAGQGLGGEIRTLFSEIRSQEIQEILNWFEMHPDRVLPSEIRHRGVDRFSRTFAKFLPDRTFVNGGLTGSQHPEFRHSNHRVPLESLSSGEKQIVFRSAFILKHGTISHRVVLIDEPEIHLHPEWQMRILEFYQEIVGVHDGKAQLIVATHSPFIVHRSLDAKVIILRRGADGFPEVDEDGAYYETGPKKLVRAFNLEHFFQLSNARVKLAVEGVTDKRIIEKAWAMLRPNQERFFDVGTSNGAQALQSWLNQSPFFAGKAVGLFDFDNAVANWNGLRKGNNKPWHDVVTDKHQGLLMRAERFDAWAMLLPVPPHMSEQAGLELDGPSRLSIEFMFPPEDYAPDIFEEVVLPGGGIGWRIRGNDNTKKQAFVEYVESLTDASKFAAFEPLFQALEKIRDS